MDESYLHVEGLFVEKISPLTMSCHLPTFLGGLVVLGLIWLISGQEGFIAWPPHKLPSMRPMTHPSNRPLRAHEIDWNSFPSVSHACEEVPVPQIGPPPAEWDPSIVSD